MKDVDGFDLCKNLGKVNDLDWTKNLEFCTYGEILSVIDVNTVRVKRQVQDTASTKVYIIRLLQDASQLKEESVAPQVGDQVLILFLRSHTDEMFLDPVERAKNSSDGDSTIYKDNCNNYTMFSGVGVLKATTKRRAYTQKTYGIDAAGPYVMESTVARMTKMFGAALSAIFDVPLSSGSDDPDEQAVRLFFGNKFPLTVESHAAIKHDIGFDTIDDTVEFDAPVDITLGSKSPVTVKSKAGADIAFDGDMKLAGDTIQLNGDAGFATEYDGLKSGLDAYASLWATELGKIAAGITAGGGTYTPSNPTFDISAAKKSSVKM